MSHYQIHKIQPITKHHVLLLGFAITTQKFAKCHARTNHTSARVSNDTNTSARVSNDTRTSTRVSNDTCSPAPVSDDTGDLARVSDDIGKSIRL